MRAIEPQAKEPRRGRECVECWPLLARSISSPSALSWLKRVTESSGTGRTNDRIEDLSAQRVADALGVAAD